MQGISERWRVGLSLAGAVLGWGWAWVGIRDTVRFYEPGPLALGRYLVASLVLLMLWTWRGARLPARRDWPIIAVMGLLGFTFYNLCINTGEKTITAGAASLIAASIPVMATLGARCFFAERLTAAGWAGIAIAFGGVAIISVGAEGGVRLSYGALLVLLASVCAAGYSLLNKRMVARYAPLEITAWAVWMGTLGLMPTGLGLLDALRSAPLSATLEVALLGVIPGAACYALWTYAISKVSMARVASWLFLVSVAAVALGWMLLGELPPLMAFAGGFITLLGVFLVNVKGHVSAGGTA
ncbi:MAG: DMT family transporter [Candidatus Sumerlaeota bacterium]|nr:DMT family transporter [Candidatus Sumerlaeota bacterium]